MSGMVPSAAPAFARRIARRAAPAWLCAGMLATGCLGGGGTDVGNALVQGTVTDGGAAVAGAEVILMPAGYNPVLGDREGRVRTTETDSAGAFRFEAVAAGPIAVEILHPDRESMGWIRPAPPAAGETLSVAAELAPARTVTVRLPAGAAPDAYVFLPGTDVHARRTAPEETLRLPHVPAESLRVVGVGRMSAPSEVALYRVDTGPADSAVDLRNAPPFP